MRMTSAGRLIVWHRLARARSRWKMCYELPCEHDLRALSVVSTATVRTHALASSTERPFRRLKARALGPVKVGSASQRRMLRWATNQRPNHPSRRNQSLTLTWWRTCSWCARTSDIPAPTLPKSRRNDLMSVYEHEGCRARGASVIKRVNPTHRPVTSVTTRPSWLWRSRPLSRVFTARRVRIPTPLTRAARGTASYRLGRVARRRQRDDFVSVLVCRRRGRSIVRWLRACKRRRV